MSFLLAQMKELKKTSTPSKASPYIGRMQTENCRNRQFSVGFGKPGHGLILFIGWGGDDEGIKQESY